jgi:KUP system potassium uptake protein
VLATAAEVPGTAVFLNRGKDTVPLALRSNLERSSVRHERIAIVSVETLAVPHADEPRRPRRTAR